MARQPYDPLHFVPSPEVVRVRLKEAMSLADRLKVLLELSERIHQPLSGGEPARLGQKAVANG